MRRGGGGWTCKKMINECGGVREVSFKVQTHTRGKGRQLWSVTVFTKNNFFVKDI